MKRAIVLGGGGSRGAYELGVWRALEEFGITYDIALGTSIGSINAAMMATRNYDAANKLWNEITVNDIMRDGFNLNYSLESMFRQKDQIRAFLKRYVNTKGADITPLRELISKSIHEEVLRKSDIEYGLVTLQVPSLKPMELTRNEIPLGELNNYIIASASCFPAFPLCKIGDKNYIDGGYYDNLAIDFAIKLGAEEIIAVDLSYDEPTHLKYINAPNVTYIRPSWPLGSFLDFNQKAIQRNIILGYNDACKIFRKYKGYCYTFEPNDLSNSNEFLMMIERFESNIPLDNGVIRLSEKSQSPLSAYIYEHTTEKLSVADYNIRGAEIAADLFDIDPAKIYTYPDMNKLLLSQVQPDTNLPDIINMAKKTLLIKGTQDSRKILDPPKIISSLITKLKTTQNMYSDFKWIASSMPRELCAAMYLFCISKLK